MLDKRETPLSLYIKEHLDRSPLSDDEIGVICGFKNGNLIRAFADGEIRPPLELVDPLGDVLGCEYGEFLTLAIRGWFSPAVFQCCRRRASTTQTLLRWKKTPEDQKSYRAPLLLVPVKLERRSASSRFSLAHHEDDVRFNATLIHLLKKDFDLDLPAFDLGLPRDESGIDVPQVLEMVRRAVRDASGFEVVDETALSTFSFAKYLMWKDLVDRTDALRSNCVVRHLIDNPDQAFEQSDATAFPTPSDIDRKFEPSELFTPLPSDSSQIAAVIAAAKGKDFVLIGPPGTGKSQTIANMIAQCLASGKSVLFVAEKTAALDVVYRRLREHGLSPFRLVGAPLQQGGTKALRRSTETSMGSPCVRHERGVASPERSSQDQA